MVRQWQELFFHERYSNTIMEIRISLRSRKRTALPAVLWKTGGTG